MVNNIQTDDSVFDVLQSEINEGAKALIRHVLRKFFAYCNENIDNLSQRISELCNKVEVDEELLTSWASQLEREGVLPKGYNHLPNRLLISNLHQDGYLSGLYVGYILVMMAMVDNDIPEDFIIATRNLVRPNLVAQHYDDRNELISKYKNDRYSWIEE